MSAADKIVLPGQRLNRTHQGAVFKGTSTKKVEVSLLDNSKT